MSNHKQNTQDLISYDPENMGLLPNIWGPHLWEGLHSITFSYPTNPCYDDKINFKNFFISLGFVLPCCMCRDSYKEYIRSGPTELTDDVLQSRKTLTKWLWSVHNLVNKKLGVDYLFTYEMLCDKYESYRAKNIMTPEIKKNCFKKADSKCTPYVNINLVSMFDKYATLRGFKNFMIKPNAINKIKIGSSDWDRRNKKTTQIIKYMRLHGKSGLETTGQYKDLPSIYELALLQYLSTSLSNEELNECVKKINL